MPWKIRKHKGKFAVYTSDGELVAEHADYRRAVRHLRALYASEKREKEGEEKAANWRARAGQTIAGRLRRGSGGKFESSEGQAKKITVTLESVGLSKSAVEALSALKSGGELSREDADSLVGKGLASMRQDGTYAITTKGRGVLAAVRSGDLAKVQELMEAQPEEKKPKAGAAKKPKAGEDKPSQEETETANQTLVSEALAKADGGMSKEHFMALSSFATGGDVDDATLQALGEMGLAEQDTGGFWRMTLPGNAVLSAAKNGELRDALDALSAGRDAYAAAIDKVNRALRSGARLGKVKECNKPKKEGNMEGFEREDGESPVLGFGGATSFEELEASEMAQEAAEEVHALTAQFETLARNIMRAEEVTDKAAAMQKLAAEFSDRVGMAMQGKEESKEAEVEDEKAVWTTAYINDLPDSAFLYIAPGGEKDADGKTTSRSLRNLPVRDAEGKIDLPHLRNAIARLPQTKAEGLTPEKITALQDKARKMLQEAQGEKSLFGKIIDAVKSVFGHAEAEPEAEPEDGAGMTLWKDTDSGAWRWFAVYSNHFRDRDSPPEILASEAHKEFIDAVDDGKAPYPELWHWHVKGSAWGRADWLAYDDETGMAMAAGYVLPGHEKEAAALSEFGGGVKVSHGMNRITRDTKDRSVITGYRTVEISDLPDYAAANELTAFELKNKDKEEDMIPEHKKAYLKAVGLTEEKIMEIEEVSRQKALRAEADGLEFKETEPEAAAPVEATPAQEYPTRQEVAEALEGMVHSFEEAIAGLTKEINSLKESEEARIAEKAANIPRASLAELISQRVIGSKEAQVDGRSELAKNGPEETKAGRGLFFDQWTH